MKSTTAAGDSSTATTAKRGFPAVSLRELPIPTTEFFGDRPPWSVVNAKEAAHLIGVDPTTYNAWTYRGRGPKPVQESKRNRTAFRLSSIFEWLYSQNGLAITEEIIWRDFLCSAGFDEIVNDADPTGLRDLIRICDPTAQLD